MTGSFKLDKINKILATDCGSTTTKESPATTTPAS